MPLAPRGAWSLPRFPQGTVVVLLTVWNHIANGAKVKLNIRTTIPGVCNSVVFVQSGSGPVMYKYSGTSRESTFFNVIFL